MLKQGAFRWFAAALLFACPALAGLRPLYGGELVLTVPAAPQVQAPAQAWTVSEVVLSRAVGARLLSAIDGAPGINGNTVRMSLRGDATWSDGSTLDGKSLLNALKAAQSSSVVALPPMTFRLEGRELVAEFPGAITDPARFFDLPWLHVTKGGESGPFRHRKAGIEANANGLGGRAFIDRVRLDVKETRKLDVMPDGLALLQPGTDGRAVFALPRVNGAAQTAITRALSGIDRAGLARLFVRTASRVPEDWPLPSASGTSTPDYAITLLIDADERDQKSVADRLQLLLRDKKISARVVSEPRLTYLSRLNKGDYDLALIALPPAPKTVQAATLLRFAKGKSAADEFWKGALNTTAAKEEDELLRSAAAASGAALLYFEAGGVARGGRVRGIAPTAAWDVDLGNAWLAPAGSAP